MNLAQFLALFAAKFSRVGAALLAALISVGSELPDEEQTVLFDAVSAANADVQAGKSIGTAIADGWTVFYNEEKGVVNQTAKYLFAALVSALAPAPAA